MAHTVESLSKLLKKTPDQVISILSGAGISGKTAESNISADERQVLMSSLSKRSSTKSSISVSRKTTKPAANTSSSGGVKIQVKKKREVPQAAPTEQVDDAAILKAREALEAGRLSEEKDEQHDAKRNDVVRQQKVKNEELLAQKTQKELTDKEEQAKKEKEKLEAEKSNDSKKSPKRLRTTPSPASNRKQLHVARHNPNRKLKKKERTHISQKTQDEQAQHGFHMPVEPVKHEILIPENIKISELALKMTTKAGEVLKVMMGMGVMATLNDVIDQDTAMLVVEEMGHTPVASSEETVEDTLVQEAYDDSDSAPRPPIVTIMGHVDHGKTSLLDHIRNENVIAGESGGITQHIGAYGVSLESGEKITFLDTPGHEAFTAMRARGAQVTDIAIIVVAADDNIMPQTKEAISHAQAAAVPIIFAINKIDKPDANPDKIKEALAGMNLMVEEWGGKIQSQDVSALKGTGVKELLEKVLLEAELLELKANPNRKSRGAVVEAFLDKGRGYVSTVLIQNGTLKMGDYMLAGKHSGKVKAIFNERGVTLNEAPPATPVSVLGLDGAPQAGDTFYVLEDEREAKQIAAKRTQLIREQSVRTQRHITLDEIGRRIALGEFKELNIILKGDVDGSVEALTDSLQKLSTGEIEVNIIHKGVGAITESDVLLASASDAIVIGFNVRPMGNARIIADKEEIDIRSYSIIYDAINDIKDAMEGMLSPEMREEITGTAEIRETFKISKIGTIAGCMVTDGKIYRNSGIRIIREGVVIHSGSLISLKRFKDDAKEVAKGYDCGLQVKSYNDIQIADVVECFQEIAVKKTL